VPDTCIAHALLGAHCTLHDCYYSDHIVVENFDKRELDETSPLERVELMRRNAALERRRYLEQLFFDYEYVKPEQTTIWSSENWPLTPSALRQATKDAVCTPAHKVRPRPDYKRNTICEAPYDLSYFDSSQNYLDIKMGSEYEVPDWTIKADGDSKPTSLRLVIDRGDDGFGWPSPPPELMTAPPDDGRNEPPCRAETTRLPEINEGIVSQHPSVLQRLPLDESISVAPFASMELW
jgi:hypothetical protein